MLIVAWKMILEKKKRKSKTNIIPPNPKDCKAKEYLGGKKSVKIFDPSSGGIGIRLKIPSNTLIITI